MKNLTKIIAVLCIVLVVSCKKPLDYYNKAVGAGNMSISLHEMESRIERIQEGFDVQPINLAARTNLRIQVNENYLKDMTDFLGDKDSDLMMKAAIAYLENDIANAKNPTTLKILNAIDKKLTTDELVKVLEPYENYLDGMYATKDELWQTYNEEVSKYAKANNIEEKFYGPNLQPVEAPTE